MLNPVRPWTALQNTSTEKPLITTSLHPFQPLDIQYLCTKIRQSLLKTFAHRKHYTLVHACDVADLQ